MSYNRLSCMLSFAKYIIFVPSCHTTPPQAPTPSVFNRTLYGYVGLVCVTVYYTESDKKKTKRKSAKINDNFGNLDRHYKHQYLLLWGLAHLKGVMGENARESCVLDLKNPLRE